MISVSKLHQEHVRIRKECFWAFQPSIGPMLIWSVKPAPLWLCPAVVTYRQQDTFIHLLTSWHSTKWIANLAYPDEKDLLPNSVSSLWKTFHTKFTRAFTRRIFRNMFHLKKPQKTNPLWVIILIMSRFHLKHEHAWFIEGHYDTLYPSLKIIFHSTPIQISLPITHGEPLGLYYPSSISYHLCSFSSHLLYSLRYSALAWCILKVNLAWGLLEIRERLTHTNGSMWTCAC